MLTGLTGGEARDSFDDALGSPLPLMGIGEEMVTRDGGSSILGFVFVFVVVFLVDLW